MANIDVQTLTEEIKKRSQFVDSIVSEASKVIVGQKILIERLLMALLCDGHVLLEGLPGLAKTLTIKTLADIIHCDFKRLQFTPDLLPSDLVGTMIFNQKTGDFTPKKGPIFTNLVLADEINRAPAKVQSALLEAMGERQVTIGETTYKLEDPFIVLATQNPIEQEGTYPLPEAQLDRFLFKVKVGYPTQLEEKSILNRMSGVEAPRAAKICHPTTILEARQICSQIYMDEKLKDYILGIVFATRFPEKADLPELKAQIQVGASPRATLSLARASRANAFIHHRGFVTPEDIKAVAYDVLRHRILVSFEAEADGIDSEQLIKKILERVEVP
ncbi:MAG TPA: ATPase [Bdellovibrionales bacterium]|nr:MAG: ATPase [Bdellovibrionales bacterium GWB1_52_6]OFZ02557.1 MAG: ATPase [Bdellovibrionales bacterium GWA1_52_35]OFZ39552.1 MAG: ATPase [Bdellovibrionales bacterium GWC1_52_8]HAR44206.1 ATPase [Bdellovibrionales bacterium]HCM41407.1 ATPase [Bdellovibrionales bacterium]